MGPLKHIYKLKIQYVHFKLKSKVQINKGTIIWVDRTSSCTTIRSEDAAPVPLEY